MTPVLPAAVTLNEVIPLWPEVCPSVSHAATSSGTVTVQSDSELMLRILVPPVALKVRDSSEAVNPPSICIGLQDTAKVSIAASMINIFFICYCQS